MLTLTERFCATLALLFNHHDPATPPMSGAELAEAKMHVRDLHGEITADPNASYSDKAAITTLLRSTASLPDTPNTGGAQQIDPAQAAKTQPVDDDEVSTLSLSATNMPPVIQGSPYSFAFSAEGGTAPYTYSATDLPLGLELNTGGTLSGTIDPSVAIGNYAPTITVSDATGDSIPIQPVLIVAAPAPETQTA